MELKQRHNITLDENHIYRVEGMIKPALTRILAPLNDFSEVPPEVLKKAAKNGSDKHLMIHYAIKGTLDLSSLTSEQRVILDNFWDWWNSLGVTLSDTHSEIRMYHPDHNLCCTADLVITDETSPYSGVFEIKFGKINDLYTGAQTAAQAEMFENNFDFKIKNRFVLFPNADGIFVTRPYKDKNDYRIYREMLMHYKNIERAENELAIYQRNHIEFISQLFV